MQLAAALPVTEGGAAAAFDLHHMGQVRESIHGRCREGRIAQACDQPAQDPVRSYCSAGSARASSTDPKAAQQSDVDAHAGANWPMIPRPDDPQRMETAERALLG
jgi:hypothetical protein